MKKNFFHNPVIKGGYPDPSICRVKDVYYMVTSSFSYFPGLPVFQSRDLVHWDQIGNAISRPDQIDYKDCDCSEGLWAATIRYHEGKFYIVNTFDADGRTNQYSYIVTTKDPAGEWSDVVPIKDSKGIDPSLFFDQEGRMWFCSNMVPEEPKYPEEKMIYLCELNPDTFQFLGEPHVILDADIDHSLYMEGPHIYEIGSYYYLITACGGTQTNHCVKMYRSKELLGPYEPCPRNPIVTNRNLRLVNDLGVSVTGHGDLVETQKGEWYMTLLGIRPYTHEIDDYDTYLPRKWIRDPDRNKNAQFNLGREVFMIPIAWDYDDWPIVDNKNGMVNLIERRPDLPFTRSPLHSRIDNFESDELDMTWCMRRSVKEPFYSLNARQGYLRLYLLSVRAEDSETPAMLMRRQQHNDFQAAVAMEFEPMQEGEEAGMIVTQNERYSYLLVKERQKDKDFVCCYQIVKGVRKEIGKAEVKTGRIYLYIEGEEGAYSFYYGSREREMCPLALKADGSILSTVVADGYIGACLGMYASGGGNASGNHADFDWFRYEIIEE